MAISDADIEQINRIVYSSTSNFLYQLMGKIH